jgi:transcriptional regulator with XRE-family HTH domain
MPSLGPLLKKLRRERGYSRPKVERLSQQHFPDRQSCHVSVACLRRLEDGRAKNTDALRLRALANIYQISTAQLLDAGDVFNRAYAISITLQQCPEAVFELLSASPQIERARQVMDWLEAKDIQAEFFFNHLMNLNDESLALLQRLLVSLSVGETKTRAASRQQVGATQDTN